MLDDEYYFDWVMPPVKRAPTRRALRAGDESKYVRSLNDLKRGQQCILVVRASTRGQKRNLPDSERRLRHQVEMHGGIVLHAVKYVGTGKDTCWLTPIAARAQKSNAVLVAESVDRFVRNQHYHPKERPNLRATDAELQELVKRTLGVPLLTLVPPNTPLNEVRGRVQSLRGKHAKGRMGGRQCARVPGYMKARYERQRPVVDCYLWVGMRMTEIVRRTGVPRPTIYRWIDAHRVER